MKSKVVLLVATIVSIQFAYAEDSASNSFWSGVAIKSWYGTLNTGSATVAVPSNIYSFNIGYANYFANVSFNGSTTYNKANIETGDDIRRNQGSINLGYFITPQIAATIGIKRIGEIYEPITGSDPSYLSSYFYNAGLS